MTHDVAAIARGDLVVVQPALEPSPSWVKRIGPLAAFFYVRWSTLGIGIEVLSAGAAIVVGPVMFGMVHIRKQIAAGDALRQHLVEQEGRS